jgi:hypothetical protein
VTIVVGDKNQAVPRIPSKSVLAFLSSSAKYLVMLTVEWASVEESTQVAAAGEPWTGFVFVTESAVSVTQYGCPIVPPGIV